jgi:F420-non-reducing hydrogenase large subunit
MSKTIKIDPVTRIEGHANIVIELGDKNKVKDAHMTVMELRGFEKILTNMQVGSMPLTTARICGICPVAHHIVSAKALDQVFDLEPAPLGKRFREIMHLGAFIHSHALSLFVLSGPDLWLGLDAEIGKRNIIGLVDADENTAKSALYLRTLGQKIVERIGGRGVHPVTAVAGGLSYAISQEDVEALRGSVSEALQLVQGLAPVVKEKLVRFANEHADILSEIEEKTYYMGTVNEGALNLYGGSIRVVDAKGKVVTDFDAHDYSSYIKEKPLEWSYMKPTEFKDKDAMHSYRVGPLARLNVAESLDTPLAQSEFEEFREKFGRPCHHTLMYHYARLIELIYVCEKVDQLLKEPLNGEFRSKGKEMFNDAVAHIEAPRGTLFHDYQVTGEGLVKSANLLVATQQNYDAINNSIKQGAEYYLKKGLSDDALKNSIEFFVRTYDPCLSCATHALGKMPMGIKFFRSGELVKTIRSF